MPAALDIMTPAQRAPGVFKHPGSITTPSNFISPATSTRCHLSHINSHSASLHNHQGNVPENDDAAERRQRRRSKVLEMQRQFQSPGTPNGDKRRSLSLNQGLSASQLTDHYANCIKLSTENKINAKNAFGLHLIDYMAELLKEKTGEMTNFQVASCTLDASAKIYAGRVDAIHADTYKMLGGLGHGDRQGKGEEGPTEAGDGAPNAAKKQKKRHSNTIEAILKNINLNKLDLGFEMDPLFHKTSAAFDEGGTFGLLLNHLTCRDDEGELLLDSTTVANTDGLQADGTTNTGRHAGLDLSEFKDAYAGMNFDSLQICPPFADFEFTNWNKDGQDDFANVGTTVGRSDHAFDVNAVPEPLEEIEPGSQDCVPGGFSDDDGDYEGVEGAGSEASVYMTDGSQAQLVGSSGCRTMSSAGQLCLQLSLEPTEYSYFNMDKLSTWAGPQHWKLKPHSKESSLSGTGDDTDKRLKTKKPVFRIDYSQDVDFDKYFTESKAATTLSKATLDKYSKSVTTLPGDLHYNPDSLFKLFLKPNFVVRRQLNNTDSMDDGIGSYNYNNANDCANFCPDTAADDDDDHDTGNDFSSAPSDFSQTCSQSSYMNDYSMFDATILQGDKLVAQPHKVAKIDIQYARTAKKMDVKKLKALMWQHLTTEEDKENHPAENDVNNKSSVAGTQSFSDLYSFLPDHLPRSMAKNLSIPIAFVCLLHLANEKSLQIVRNDEDLVISQD